MKGPKPSFVADAFGPSFWVFVAVAAITGWATWELKGAEAFHEALSWDIDLLIFLLPRMIGGMLLAGLVQAIMPPDLVAKWVGAESGLRGIVIAAAVGMLTPGGPMTSFPIVIAFYMSGADRGALVAYITGWSLLGFQRTLVWELPLLGTEFTHLRFTQSRFHLLVDCMLFSEIFCEISFTFLNRCSFADHLCNDCFDLTHKLIAKDTKILTPANALFHDQFNKVKYHLRLHDRPWVLFQRNDGNKRSQVTDKGFDFEIKICLAQYLCHTVVNIGDETIVLG